MSLAVGTRIGPYEVTGVLGAGGMGQVYRARDTKLGRAVALKVISEAFALDPERLARFRREAQVLASLNHPHIGAIYGLEDSGDTHALVLELVEGDTLADRIAHGPLPLDQALSIARQIAEALEAAHEHGIVHRDLKPANIKVTPDGVVKVLDFGLAKLTGPAEAGPHGHPDFSQSPTITSPALMTGIGMLLGTAAYMSPEQAKGRPADKRSDVWAFGCVLYEMLTGRRAFEGEDIADTLANVLKVEPLWSALPPNVPVPIRTVLSSCLVKDRGGRVAEMSTMLFVLDKASSLAAPVDSVAGAASPPTSRWRPTTAMAAAVTSAALLAGVGVWWLSQPYPPAVVRTTITTSGATALALDGTDRDVVITPDGSRVVYRGNRQLLVRPLDQLNPSALSVGPGPGPRGLFISPDGQWVGFFNGNELRKVAITGGSPVTVSDGQGVPRGATWGPDGTIVFAIQASTGGLQRVSAAGGAPVVLTKPDRGRGEGDHRWPEFLPGGKAVLFTMTAASGSIDDAQIAVLDLRTGTSKVLIQGGSHAHYVPTGHLVYGVSGTLRAVAFDVGRLEVVGTPAPVLEGVVTTGFGAADLSVAGNGSLVYVPGVEGRGRQTIMTVDRQGNASPLAGLPPDSYRDVRVSPDGARLALATQTDIWTYDFERATLTRLTTHPASDRLPLWTPDGARIIFTSNRSGYPELLSRAADGGGGDEPLLTRGKDLIDLRSNGWSADGKQLLFTEVPPSNQSGVWQVTIGRASEPQVLLKNDSNNDFAAISPDGRWMAYRSSLSGRTEIYVERYPELGGRQTISTGGGMRPLWSRDGRELFFSSPDGQMLAVPVRSGPTLVVGRPQVLFEFEMFVAQGGRPFDIARDGRFVIIRSAQADANRADLILVQNWFEELKRLLPVD